MPKAKIKKALLPSEQFDLWFKNQFGHHPNDYRSYQEIEKDLKYHKILFDKFRDEWEIKVKCDEQWQAATYTRNASKRRFKFK